MPLNIPTNLADSRRFLTTLFDAIPCGVIVVDEHRMIRAANEIFARATGLQPDAAIGTCEGAAIGCLNAAVGHCHSVDVLTDACKICEARQLAAGAISSGETRRGKVHFQIAVEGRVEDVALTLTAAPFESEQGRFAIVIIEDISRLERFQQPDTAATTLGMVGGDSSMLELFDTIRQVGPLDVPVLILGESGTGKELVANALHAESTRCGELLVPVNCGALPDGLLESELFGHVKGAFTGAVRDKKGRFELADRGTIFLDEIGELSPQMQVKFLRVLQNGTFERVGGERTVEVDARVICATNRDLEAEVEAGRFRADLYYRLCVVPITVPPLLERPGDIPDIAGFFLARTAEETARHLPGFSDEALEALKQHTWPGNVRELENAVRFAAIKSQGHVIRPSHLPLQVRGSRKPASAKAQRCKLDEVKVREALQTTGGNKSRAAKHLGVSRATLYRFLGEHPALG